MESVAERLAADVQKNGAERDAATQTHKLASRSFFNTLESFYPPENTPEYWERLFDRILVEYVRAGKPPLLKHLFVATIDYLEEIAKSNENKETDRNDA